MEENMKGNIIKAHKSTWDKDRAVKIIKKGLYEVWFTMVDDLERGEAYWIRYTLVCPQTKIKLQKGQGLDAFVDSLKGDGMLWLGYFNVKEPSKNFMVKKSFPLTSVEGSKEEAGNYSVIKIKDAELYLDGLKGGFETRSGKTVSWDLKFSHFMEPYITTPDAAKKLKMTNTLAKATHPNLRISGKITIDGNSKELKSVPGVQYHTLGDKYSIPWEWSSSHTFKNSPDAYLDLGYKINKGTLEFTNGEKRYTNWNENMLKKIGAMKRIKRERSLDHLTFSIEQKDVIINGEITVPMKALLGVEYKGPCGEKFYCYNSEIASCAVKIAIKNPDGSTKEEKEFHAENSVSFETVYDRPQEGVVYLPWEKEEL
jgi:hypothetical protein